MSLSTLNTSSPAEAAGILKPCVDIPRWVNAIVDARPFSSEAELIDFAERAAYPWTEAEIDGALAHHPRIGDRAQGNTAEATMSRGEQAGVSTAVETQTALQDGNRAYEEKFNRVFLIRAAGRSAEEILAALNERLGNSPEQELDIIAVQLREIAILRLKGVLAA
ncbi:2-oxo-4-hydroxy-4-carboxy-5-ureidoimidazoline decarboxylase [Arthrobacter pigmenti]|uniref:2-oxo-4-hydroxy-4-carboxy-5-ureidoimidazoline decarboxylase n=1 Tax=Arthrobacter pigmenti TaxID=271432 RepID=A0A846RYK8_9MICC|nr:2-oxo-4-hydroxy-4-carboxy-5-ureidoimidazoline decarboxylase [Arthrobacter pigmenti]NJC24046.1 2-oxo-4-hydroxy-4-carboxy-5-ureidoimidazoline decarboxylase [Arthrobacter pigmenti]